MDVSVDWVIVMKNQLKIKVISNNNICETLNINEFEIIVAKNISMENYIKILKCGKKVISFYEDENYVFIGPLLENEKKDSCFACFLNSLRRNKSPIFERLNRLIELNLQKSSENVIFFIDFIKDNIMNLKNRVYIIDKYDFSIEKRRIFKNVECTVCSREDSCIEELFSHFNADYLFSKSYRSKDIEDIISENEDIFSELVNKDTGIGYRIFRDVSSNIIPMYCVKSCIKNREFYSYGRSSDVIYSKYAAIFEMIERYSTIVPHFNGSIYGSYTELKSKFDNVLHPKEFTMPDKSQFTEKGYSLKVYDDNKKYYWRKVYEINSKEIFWIPEQMIFFDNQIINEEERFIYETSNGSALGANLEEAIMYALFEVVERDSFLVYWYNKMPPVRLNIDEIDNIEIDNIIKYLKKKGYAIYLFDITLETRIPTIWALVVDEKDVGRVKAYNAAGSHINPEKALESALVEIVTSLSVYNEILSTPEKIKEIQMLKDNPSAVTKMEYHVYFYSLKGNFKYLEFVLKNNSEIKFKDAYYEWYKNKENKHTLSDIIFKISKNHPRIYIADTNSYITKELNMSSVKVIIPSMLTMTFGNQNRRLNYERILTAPIIAGKKRYPIDVKDINLIPHPFP